MAGRERTPIDLSELERELVSAIEQDVRYWQQNDAKIRAVNQRVATYEDFREMVMAAHLKPVIKTKDPVEDGCSSAKGDSCCGGNNCCANCSNDLELCGENGTNSGSVWNPLVANKKLYSQLDEMENDVYAAATQSSDPQLSASSTSTAEFMQMWRSLDGDAEKRFAALARLGTAPLGHLFASSEIPVGLLGEILEALLHFRPSSPQDICFVVRLLLRLTRAKRFCLTLEFLSSSEKAMCSQLLSKLNRSLVGQQQDLAERGVTEWTLRQLHTIYRVQ